MRMLESQVAVITGGASGLGRETALLFAEHGAAVVVADVSDDEGDSVVQTILDGGGEARYVHADVRRAAELDAAVALAEREFGQLNIMVANAGIQGRASFNPTESVSDEDWAEVLDVNLAGAFRSFRAAIPAVRRAGGGAFSATSSVAGMYATLWRAAYSASKGGMNALVRALAVELAPDRIRVNAVCPGRMETAISRSLGRAEISVERPDTSGKSRLGWAGRMPREAAQVHLFLCSPLAGYVNGEILVADGGFSVWNGT